jgi:hypothetical protein
VCLDNTRRRDGGAAASRARRRCLAIFSSFPAISPRASRRD